MKKRNVKRYSVILFSVFLILASLFAVIALAEEKTDAMTAIEASLAEKYRVLEPTVIANDGYIGIPVEYSVYYDTAKGNAVPGFTVNGGTPMVMYIVNTETERVGTDSDVNIIQSMLDRGFIVAVIDYQHNPRSVSPAIDWSTQELRRYFGIGNYISNASCIPKGSYKDNYVVPAGCNVSINNIFWEADKHAAAGTLEKIVETWNNDFRGTTGDIIIKWVDENGNRKATQNAPSSADGAHDKDDPRHDGSAPVWYMDAKGTPETEEGAGQYIQVKHTLATSVYDCIDPDGKPIDLNLYMHIVYPTSPQEAVPVTALANSSCYPTTSKTGADMRPHSNGFLFRGYANVVFDYLWVPMARMASYDYFDGRASAGAVTSDQLSYSLQVYNDKRINTAAMRFLRHVNNENEALYNFDTDNIGVYGNSKGGWFTFVGSAELHNYTEKLPDMTLEESIDARINAYTSKRIFPEHDGETRYQIGEVTTVTKNGMTVDGGELQPWLTYTTGEDKGKEILSWATVLYPCCAPAYEDIEDGHAPMFLSSNINDEYRSAYFSSNIRTNIAKEKDVPSLTLETEVAHMLTYGEDLNWGVDSYDAFFDFFGYYLKGENVKVVYVSPKSGDADVSAYEKIIVQFIGSLTEEEIAKITVTDNLGNTVSGSWSAAYGSTEWTFTPTVPLAGGLTYTVTIPETITSDNGTTLGKTVTSSFTVKYGKASEAVVSGDYIKATVPEMSDNNGYAVRFEVKNDAANIASLLAVANDSAVTGEYIGSVNLIGKGYYEIDATDYIISKNAGDEVIFLVKCEKEIGTETVKDDFIDTNSSGYTTGSDYRTRFAAYVRDGDTKYPNKGDKHEGVEFDGASAVKFVMGTSGKVYTNLLTQSTDIPYNEFYLRLQTALFNNTLINKGNKLTEEDYGRKFEIKLRIYDTTSRDVLFYVESMSGYYNDYTYKTMDYNQSIANFNTKAGEWVELTLEYTVRDTDFGKASEYEAKQIMLEVSPEGYMEGGSRVDYPMYIDYLSVTETVTDIELGLASIVATNDGSGEYKAPSEGKAVTLLSGSDELGSYDTLAEAMAAAGSGNTVRLNRSVTLTDSTVPGNLADISALTLDLGGYKLIAKTKAKAPFNFAANSIAVSGAIINVKNGSVYFGDTPLVSYVGSTSSGAGKSVRIGFENVFFALEGRTAYATELISESALPEGAELSSAIGFTDCTFSIEDGKLSKMPSVMFPVGTGSLDLSYTVLGGEIRLDSERWLAVTNGLRALTFAPSSGGSYTTFRLPLSEAADDSAVYTAEKGIANLKLSNEANSFGYYSLEAGELSTKYGIIPDSCASVTDHPFVIFDAKGSFVASKTLFQNVLEAFKNTPGADWYVVMRTDYTYTKKYDNVGQGKGKLHVDLGGHTMTLSGVMMYNLDAKKNGDIKLTTVNGTVLVDSLGAVRLLGWDTADYDIATVKNIDVAFKNVTFKLAGSSSDLVTYNHDRAASGNPGPMNSKLNFTDCTFDITGATKKITLFNVGSENSGQPISGAYEIFGGKIIADAGENLVVYKIGEENSSITFKRGSDGEFTKVLVTAGGSAPVAELSTPEGDMELKKSGSESGYEVYVFEEKTVYEDVKTEYGTIPSEYATPTLYPIAIFNKAKEFVKATDDFTVDAAKAASGAGDGAVILIRADLNLSGDLYGNNFLSTVNGTITVDLGGNSVEMGTKPTSGRDAFIRLEACCVGYTTNIVVKNGELLTGDNPIVRFAAINGRVPTTYNDGGTEKAFSYWNNTNPELIHNLSVTLDGVKITLGSVSGKYLLLYTGASSGYTVIPEAANNKLILKNCDLDFTDPTFSAPIFASNVSVPADVILEGGTLTYNDNTKIKWEELNVASDSELSVAPNESGEYLTVKVPEAMNLSTERVVYKGDTAFTYELYKKAASEGVNIFTFRPKELKNVSVTESLTLSDDFILKLYVTKHDAVSAVKIGDAVYGKSELESYINGDFYVIPYAIKLTDAECDIKAEVTLSFAEDYKSEYTVGLIEYAKAGLLGSEWTEAEKAMVSSMLSFTKAAYSYFASVEELDSAKVTALEAKLEGLASDTDYTVPAAENNTVGLSGATVNIGSEIKIFFFPKEGFAPESFSFKIGDTALTPEVKDGRIELSIPHYMLGEAIEYTVEGAEGVGAYNLSTYYTYMAGEGEGSELLLDLVEKLLAYVSAAKAKVNA